MAAARNVPQALVDCGCETTVYSDGSGVEIHYCSVHGAAPDLLEALKALLDIAPFVTGLTGTGDVEIHRQAEAVIAKAEARQ